MSSRSTQYAAELHNHCDNVHRETCSHTQPEPTECAEATWLRARWYATFRTGEPPDGWSKANPRPRS